MDFGMIVTCGGLIGSAGVLILFATMVITIQAADRRRHLSDANLSRPDALTRRLLRAYAPHHRQQATRG